MNDERLASPTLAIVSHDGELSLLPCLTMSRPVPPLRHIAGGEFGEVRHVRWVVGRPSANLVPGLWYA